MKFYRTCPECGASLDPDESCDCTDRIFADAEKRTGMSRSDLIGRIWREVEEKTLTGCTR